MYLSPRKHYLSNALFLSALIRLLGVIADGIARVFYEKSNIYEPDMEITAYQFWCPDSFDDVDIYCTAYQGSFTYKESKEKKLR